MAQHSADKSRNVLGLFDSRTRRKEKTNDVQAIHEAATGRRRR